MGALSANAVLALLAAVCHFGPSEAVIGTPVEANVADYPWLVFENDASFPGVVLMARISNSWIIGPGWSGYDLAPEYTIHNGNISTTRAYHYSTNYETDDYVSVIKICPAFPDATVGVQLTGLWDFSTAKEAEILFFRYTDQKLFKATADILSDSDCNDEADDEGYSIPENVICIEHDPTFSFLDNMRNSPDDWGTNGIVLVDGKPIGFTDTYYYDDAGFMFYIWYMTKIETSSANIIAKAGTVDNP